MALTLAESMALAVLKGDEVAAYALADRLLEERQADPRKAARDFAGSAAAVLAFEVFGWPEFRALMKRLNVPIDLGTTHLEIILAIDAAVEIRHGYVGQDVGEQPLPPSEE